MIPFYTAIILYSLMYAYVIKPTELLVHASYAISKKLMQLSVVKSDAHYAPISNSRNLKQD